jgi:hypothetical protein
VPKAGEGAVQGLKARASSGNSLPGRGVRLCRAVPWRKARQMVGVVSPLLKGRLGFGHFLPNSLAEANPQGWQRVAGGRTGQRGDDHRKIASEGRAPREGCQSCTLARTNRLGSRSGTPAGVPGISCAVTRRSPAPQKPRRPPATLWQPFGLAIPECPNSPLRFRLPLSRRRSGRGEGRGEGTVFAYQALQATHLHAREVDQCRVKH